MLRKKLALSLVCLLVFNMLFSFNFGTSFAAKKLDKLPINVEEIKEEKNEKKEDKEEQKGERKEAVEEKKNERSEEETSDEAKNGRNDEKQKEPKEPAALELVNELEVAEELVRTDEMIESLNIEFLKKFKLEKKDIVEGKFVANLKNGKVKVVSESRLKGLKAVKINGEMTLEEMIYEIELDEEVLSARPLVKVFATDQPNDEYYTMYDTDPDNALWGIFQTSGNEIFGRISNANLGNVEVAVIDSGIMTTHEDLDGNITLSPNMLQLTADPDDPDDPYKDYSTTEDDYGHGTHVAGTIGATYGNTVGVVGVATGVKLMSVKVLNGTGNGNDVALAEGIRWAADNNADVINMSLGLSGDLDTVRNAVQYAASKGVVMVAAAGNSNQRSTLYPAAYPEVICVGAVAWDSVNGLKEAWFSNASNPDPLLEEGVDEVDVTAPGVNIISTYIDPNYLHMNGTSMSAPHVTGLAALIKAGNNSATVGNIKEIIRGTAQTSDLPQDVTYPSGATFSEKYGEGLINYALALDATLGEELLTSVEVDTIPAVEITTSSYAITVNSSTTEVIVEPIKSDASKEIAIKLTGGVYETVPSKIVPITSDATVVMIKATAFGGAVVEYTLTINFPSSDSSLIDLSLSEGTLVPVFSSGVLSYGISEDYVIDEVLTVTATKSHYGANVEYYLEDVYVHTGVSAAMNLVDGLNNIKVKVIAETGDISEYIITINKAYSDNNLSSLSITEPIDTDITPTFDFSTLNYTATVSLVDQVTIIATKSDENATMKINNIVYVSGDPRVISGLVEGDNPVDILVTAQNGDTKNYQLTIHKKLSENRLDSITLSDGTLTPSFDSLTNNYDVSVVYAVDAISVDVVRTSTLSTVKINGIDTMLYDMPLVAGNNICEIVVTAENGAVNTYSLTINRGIPSTDSSLTGLFLSEGTLDPTFDGGVLSYGILEEFVIVGDLTITVTKSHQGATVEYYLEDVPMDTGASAILSLADGLNNIKVKVIAESGDYTEYFLTIIKASSNTELLSLSITEPGGTIVTPTFDSGTLTYSAVVSLVDQVIIVATKSDENAQIKIDGTDYISGSPKVINGLIEGDTIVNILVIAQDGSTKNYQITIHKELSENRLNSILLSEGSLAPSFDSSTNEYDVTVENAVDVISINAVKASVLSTVEINGNSTESYIMQLVVGDNICEIVVTAENGVTNTYTLTINRLADSKLSNLTISQGDLSLGFNVSVFDYTANVDYEVASLVLVANKSNDGSTIKINGADYVSGSNKSILLTEGSNTIVIVVTASDNSTSTYNLVVTRDSEVIPPIDPPTVVGGGGGGFQEPTDDVKTDDNGDVTVTVSFERIEKLIKNLGSTLVIEAEGNVRSNTVSVDISKEIIDLLLNGAKNLEIRMNGLKIELSYELLSNFGISDELQVVSEKISDENIDRILAHRPENTTSLTPVYELRIKDGGSEIKNFGEEIKYTLEVDSSLMNDVKEVEIYHVNDNTGEYELVSSKVESSNKISFETSHNSKYVALEPLTVIPVELMPEAGFGVDNNVFYDINTHWAKSYIEELASLGIVKGVSETEFAPDSTVTRAQFAAYLMRSLELSTSGGSQRFVDVDRTDWFYDAVMSTYQAGIVSGMNEFEFKPNDYITREQMATMLIKAFLYQSKVDINSIVLSQEIRFNDQSEISSWALKYVLISNGKGYMLGDPSKNFRPRDNATRAEAVTVIYNLVKDVELGE